MTNINLDRFLKLDQEEKDLNKSYDKMTSQSSVNTSKHRKVKTLLLISCCKSKLSRPAQARYLYTSSFFQKSIKFAENNGFDIKIISALHGFIDLDFYLWPYDLKLQKKSDIENLKKLVIPRLMPLIQNYDRIIVIMGKNYGATMEDLLSDKKFLIVHDRRGFMGFKQLMTKLLTTTINDIFYYLNEWNSKFS